MSKTENILLSLKYCWMLNREHIQRLHFPDKSIKAVQDVLTNLKDQGLVDKLNWGNPVRQPSMWFLTDTGDQSIRRLAAYPDERKRSRPRAVLEHDKRTLDMIVTIIELARHTGLSGIKVFREVKLNPDPKVRRPILDALVIFEVGGSFSEDNPDLVPWSLDKPLTDESLWRVCLEADNNTEANQVIAGKALSYQQVLNNQAWWHWWCERYGRSQPWVMWVAPTEQRVASIVAHWEQTWNGGQWLAATDAGLQENSWTLHYDRESRHNQAIGFPARAATSSQATATATIHQDHQEQTAEQSRQNAEAARKQRQEEEDALAFSLPLNQRLQQLRNVEQLTGALNLTGRPIYRLGGCCTSDPRFRPEEAAAFAAHIRQEHALYAARMQVEAERRRVNNEQWRLYQEQQKKEDAARAAAQARQARRVALRRGIAKAVIDLLLLLVPMIGLYLLLLTMYNLVHQTPAELLAEHVRSRMEQGMGQCGEAVRVVTIWLDQPAGQSSTTLNAGTRVVRLGETWDSWPFPDQWVKVRTSYPELGVFLAGWVDKQDIRACSV
jgi:hypothetical protein